MKLLLTDLNARKCFDLFNIFSANHPGVDLVLATHQTGLVAKGRLNLVYGRDLRTLRKDSQVHFDADLSAILDRHASEEIVYLPVEEDTTALFYGFLEKYGPRNLRFLLPPAENFSLARDKALFSAYCSGKGFPVPREYAVSEIESLSAEEFRPLIVKPRIGSGAQGIRFIRAFSDLRGLKDLDLGRYVAQELLDNSRDILGAFYLFRDGKMLAFYGHRRLRTYPSTGGVTTYSRLSANEEVRETGRLLLEELRWSGLAMIEFLHDPRENRYKIIELNPRIWASFMLSEFSGQKFLINYVNAALARPHEAAAPRKEAYIRWLFPFDLVNYFAAGFRIPGFWKLNLKNTCYINFSYSTPFRAVAFLFTTLVDPGKIGKLFGKLRGK